MRRGSIVWAALHDPDDGKPILDIQGNPKCRPCLVLSSDAKIAEGKGVIVAGISTSFDRSNLPAGWYLVPNAVGGDPITGLDQPCVVKSEWIEEVNVSDITNVSPGVCAQLVKLVVNFRNTKRTQ